MSQNSPRLELPFLQASQAQKHITHNEALRRLDIVTQLSVASINATIPPAVPEQGEVHALGDVPTGDWSGQAGSLAVWLDSAWHFVPPRKGWRAWDESAEQLLVWDGNAWIKPPIEARDMEGLGIATGYDSTNRLSVRSPATLFSHDGGGHQLKINKAEDSETASLLFQSNWTGHAEMGLSGSNGFSIKVSADGGTWTEALSFNPANGIPGGAAVQASADDTTPGRLMRTDYGYSPGNVLGTVSENGGAPTGAVIECGSTSNGEYVRYADGTQICFASLPATNCTNPDGTLFASGTAIWNFPVPFAAMAPVAVSGSGGANSRFIGFDTPVETQVNLKVMATTNDATALIPTVTAIGRWF